MFHRNLLCQKLDKLIGRLDKLDSGNLQTQFLRLAQEKGLLETIFHAIQEGIIVLPEKDKENWNLYRTSPEVAEGVIMDLFETRRSNFQATGRYV